MVEDHLVAKTLGDKCVNEDVGKIGGNIKILYVGYKL
jgi:hypothetical protein